MLGVLPRYRPLGLFYYIQCNMRFKKQRKEIGLVLFKKKVKMRKCCIMESIRCNELCGIGIDRTVQSRGSLPCDAWRKRSFPFRRN